MTTTEETTAPVKSGTIFHHYAEVYERLGRRRARATEGNSDSGLAWWYFRNVNEDQAREQLEAMGNDTNGYRCGHEHDCCGCIYWNDVSFRHVGNRLLATQSWGRNI